MSQQGTREGSCTHPGMLQPHTHRWPWGPLGSRWPCGTIPPREANCTLGGTQQCQGSRQGTELLSPHWCCLSPLPLPVLQGLLVGQAARCPLSGLAVPVPQRCPLIPVVQEVLANRCHPAARRKETWPGKQPPQRQTGSGHRTRDKEGLTFKPGGPSCPGGPRTPTPGVPCVVSESMGTVTPGSTGVAEHLGWGFSPFPP